MSSRLRSMSVTGLALWLALPCLGEPAKPEEPLTLEQAVGQALANNPSLPVAARKIEAAKARIGQAAAQSKATVDLSGRYTRQGPTVSFNIPGGGSSQIVPPDSHNVNVHAQKVIYSGGRLQRAPVAAEHAASAAEHDYETAREAVALNVKQAYFGVLKARRFREVAEEAVTQAAEHRRLAGVRFEAGAVAKFDVIRSEVEVANAQQQLVEADSAVGVAEAAFNSALGRPLETPVVLAAAAPAPEFTLKLDTCLSAAAASRPELQSLAATTQAAETQLEIAQAGKKPTVAVTADYNRKVATAFGSDYDWNTTLSVQLPILDGKLTRARTEEASATVAQLAGSREQLLQGIALQVKSAYLSADQSFRRIATATKTIEQAQEALRIARVRYENGMGTNIEVSDAELALTQAKTNEARALYDYYAALADLEHAVGQDQAALLQAQGEKAG
ncbi:MAG: TolC family protein [Armatimonadetes bacterium]|nr:TolC family protein [Armatimonadota bacterium]NCO91528.1 TolC family protein [Armatimonadota bacterium]NCP30167.1 TolC family protein [Armatimonadota bacterium]NCQ31473.1 TolC family protein [Armatimonadota bacterium]NDK11312.1 TolC family protein [Armatimonadota bacterium]